MKVNYQLEMEKIIAKHQANGECPSLMLHSCCAPCSSYVLEYLSAYFKITVLYYNPNIYPDTEYYQREAEQKAFLSACKTIHPIEFLAGDYNQQRFYEIAKGLEAEPEGGERCFRCYRLRLEETAKLAIERNFDYFTTTLSISPLKQAQKLNEIGLETGVKYGISYLVSDFKKKGGYQRSIALSREYGMYRQDYCGCVFSIRERGNRCEQGGDSSHYEK